MFVSASTNIKLHTYSTSAIETCLEYKPINRLTLPQTNCIIQHVSWSKNNGHLALLQSNHKPLIITTGTATTTDTTKNNNRKCNKDGDGGGSPTAAASNQQRIVHVVQHDNVSVVTFRRKTSRGMALATYTGHVMLYDIKSRITSPPNHFPHLPSAVHALAFTCDEQQLCGLYDDCLFVFANNNTTKHVMKVFGRQTQCTVLRCHPVRTNYIAVASRIDGHISLLDIDSCGEIATYGTTPIAASQTTNNDDEMGAVMGITEVAFAPRHNLLISGGLDGHINAIDLTSGLYAFQIQAERAVTALDVGGGCCDRIVAGLCDGSIELYDMRYASRPLFVDVRCHRTAVNRIRFENQQEGGKMLGVVDNKGAAVAAPPYITVDDDNKEGGGGNDDNKDVMVKEKEKKEEEKEEEDQSVNVVVAASVNPSTLFDHLKNTLMDSLRKEMDRLVATIENERDEFKRHIIDEFRMIDAKLLQIVRK